MITASANYQAVVSEDSRTFRAQFLASGTALPLDIMALRIFKGTGDGTILPGSIYSSYIECTVLNNAAIVADAELTLQIGLVLTRDPETIEWLTIGKYTISDVSRGYYQTEFTAVSTLSAKGGGTYSSTLTFPATTAAIAADVATQMGATVTIDSSFTTNIPVTLTPENYTCRGVLSILAGLLGGFVTEDNLGNVVIKPFNGGGTLAQGTGRVTQDPKYSSTAYTVTGVKCIVSPATEETAEVSYVYGDPINLTMTNKFMTQGLFDEMRTHVVGLTGYGGEVNLALGDPRIEPGDALSMTDRSGVVRSVPCNTVEIVFDGGVQTNITCVTETETQATTTVKGNLTAMAENAQATAEAAQTIAGTAQTIATAAQTAVGRVAQHFWYDAETGAHVSEQVQGAAQTDYVLITSDGMEVYAGGTSVAQYGADGVRIGPQTHHVTISEYGMATAGNDPGFGDGAVAIGGSGNDGWHNGAIVGSVDSVTKGFHAFIGGGYGLRGDGRSHAIFGEYNIVDKPDLVPGSIRGEYAFIVGNGDSATRSNAYTLDWSGNGQYAGGVYVGAKSVGEVWQESSIGIDSTGAANLASATLSGSLRFDGQLIKSTTWNVTTTINTAYGNIYRSAELTKDISSWGFTSAPKVWLQSTGLQCWAQVTSVSTTTVTYYLVRGSSLGSSRSITLDLLCIGTTS